MFHFPHFAGFEHLRSPRMIQFHETGERCQVFHSVKRRARSKARTEKNQSQLNGLWNIGKTCFFLGPSPGWLLETHHHNLLLRGLKPLWTPVFWRPKRKTIKNISQSGNLRHRPNGLCQTLLALSHSHAAQASRGSWLESCKTWTTVHHFEPRNRTLLLSIILVV